MGRKYDIGLLPAESFSLYHSHTHTNVHSRTRTYRQTYISTHAYTHTRTYAYIHIHAKYFVDPYIFYLRLFTKRGFSLFSERE